MSSVDSILDTERFSEWIGLQTKASNKCLTKQLSDWNYDLKKLSSLSGRFKRFKDAFEKDPKFFGECHEIFKEIAEIEKKLNTLIHTNSQLEKESYNELLFFQHLDNNSFLAASMTRFFYQTLPAVFLLFLHQYLRKNLEFFAPYSIIPHCN